MGLNNLLKTKKLDKTANVSWQDTGMLIREAVPWDENLIWAILEPIIRTGETYTLPRDMDRGSALAYWLSPGHEVFVAEDNGEIVGTYFLKANQKAAERTLPIVVTLLLATRRAAAWHAQCARTR